MMKSAAILVCSLLFTCGLAQTRESVVAEGSIYGIAVNSDGQPAKGMVLTAFPLGVTLGAALPATRTNDWVFIAWKRFPGGDASPFLRVTKKAGYSQFSTSPLGNNPPEVSIDIDHPKAQRDIHLPRKAGCLLVNLINSRTKIPISLMRVELMKAAEPTKVVFSIGYSADHVGLIPPDEDLLVHIISEGFMEWSESLDKGRLIHLSSGTEPKLLVELEP